MTVNYYEWCSHSSCENRALLFQSFRESTLWNFYGPGKHLPVFLGSAAVFQKYLLVRFKENRFEVSIVNSTQGANYQLVKEGVYPLY
ncbi:hypothetical protein [Endozoicomonas sp.]|uniref:hypothetical protein n=1 Tax=Endozoicomonas sp. TaxID=1892382 RepID=UPI003AF597C1